MKSTYLFCPIVSKSFTTIPREDEKSSGTPLKSNSKICPQKGYETKMLLKRSGNILNLEAAKGVGMQTRLSLRGPGADSWLPIY